MPNKLIITLKIEESRQFFFEEKRQFYYPDYCNCVPAHLTFFHAAPHSDIFINTLIKELPEQPLYMETLAIIPFENGMAYEAKSIFLEDLHSKLQQEFLNEFSGKDKKIWKPHITIQNKVTAFKAKKNYSDLAVDFKSFNFKVEGFNVYIYAKKKWLFKQFIPFIKS